MRLKAWKLSLPNQALQRTLRLPSQISLAVYCVQCIRAVSRRLLPSCPPTPGRRRAASVWNSGACWRDCRSNCTWKMEYCVGSADADACRPHLDACDRSCQRSCRGFSAGPLLGFVDW